MHEFVIKHGCITRGDIYATGAITSSIFLGDLHGTASITETASLALTASNVLGAMLYQVSGSDGIAPAYLEPYDYSPIDQIYQPPYKAGRVFWDNRYNDWAWYAATGSNATSFRAHLGKEVMVGVHNPYSVTLPRLSVVYVGTSSVAGQYQPDVYLAQADGTGTKSNVLGIVRNDIPSGSNGFVLTNGVMHRTNMGPYSVGEKLWLSPTVPGGLTNVQPGQPNEQILIGYCSEAGALGSFICRQSTIPAPAQAFAGITSTVTISNNNNGTITVSTGSVNLYPDSTGVGVITPYSLGSKTFSVITGSTNYVIAEHSASVASYGITTDPFYANGISIVRVAILDINYKGVGDWDIHEFDIGIVGLALANRTNNKDIRLYGYQRENGLTLYTTGSNGQFGISAGTVWYGPNAHSIPVFDTTLNGYYTYLFNSSASVWTQTSQSKFVSGYYNAPTGVTPCAPLSWSVNYVYRLMGTDDESAIIMSSAQFDNSSDARNYAATPSNLPSTIRDIGLLVGRFIVQSGSYANTIVDTAWGNVFIPSSVTDHEDLFGLQGGIGGEHRHLTAAEYTGTGTGVFLRAYKPVFTAATPGHIPYWGVDQTLTLTGSLQVVQDKYVTINSASITIASPEALLVKQVNTSSVNTLGAYSDVNNYSQIYNQNNSTGSNASTDFVATADVGGQSSNYVDMGINGSGYVGTTWPWSKALDGYILMDGGDLWLGLDTDNKLLFAFNNTASTSYANKSGFYLSGSLFGTSSVALKAISASYAPSNPQALQVSASWASASLSASYAPTNPQPLQVSASWASSSLSASYAPFTQTVQNTVASASWVSASAFITLAQSASYVLNAVSASYAPSSTAGSSISASWASSSLSSSYVSQSITFPTANNGYYVVYDNNTLATISFLSQSATKIIATAPIVGTISTASYVLNAVSASWVGPSTVITTAQTASYVASANVSGKVSTAVTADTASYVLASNVSGKVATATTADTASGLTYKSVTLAAPVTMSNQNQWYDGPAVLLPAGVWYVSCFLSVNKTAATAGTYITRINANNTVYAQAQQYMTNVASSTTLKMDDIITLASQTGITGSALTNGVAAFINHATVFQSSGSVASQITAIKVG